MREGNEFIKQFYQWKFWEKVFLSIEFLLVVLLSFILYLDFQRRLEAGTREQIGVITFKQRTVQRKYSDRAVWEDMESSFPIYNRDSIRTGDISDAEIVLKDGTKLEVDENSFIVLNMTEDSKEIQFGYGSIVASGASEDVKISLGEKSISLKDSKINLSQMSGKDVFIEVREGVANLFKGDTKTEIRPGENLIIREETEEKVQKPFRILRPSPSTKLVYSGASVNLEFLLDGWENSKKGVFELSTSRNFKEILYKKNITSAQFQETFTRPGSYYWRIVQDQEIASVGKVSVIRINPSRLISPPNQTKIFLKAEKQLVSFQWSKEEGVNQYELEISRDTDFSQVIERKSVLGNSMSIELPEGIYYWRVRSVISREIEPILSLQNTVILTKEEVRSPPNLLHPKPGDEFASIIVEKSGISFFWSPVNGYDTYELEISPRRDFSNSKFYRSEKAHYLVQDTFELEEYFWRVRGIAPSGKKGDPSEVFSFRVKKFLEKNIFNLQSESVLSESEIARNGILLRWKKLPVNGKYEVVLSRDKDFKEIVKKIITSLNQVTIRELNSGKYYWKVSLLDESNETVTSSDFKTFEVMNTLGPLSPKNGERINMTNRDFLLFEWEKRSGVNNYTILIYQDTTNGKRAVLQKSSSTNRFILNELDVLDEGRFEWEIYYDERGEKRKEFTSEFYIELDPLPDVLEILSPGIQYAD